MLKTTDNYFIMLTYPLHLLTTDFVFSLQFLKDCAHKKCIFLYNSAQGLHMGWFEGRKENVYTQSSPPPTARSISQWWEL